MTAYYGIVTITYIYYFDIENEYFRWSIFISSIPLSAILYLFSDSVLPVVNDVKKM